MFPTMCAAQTTMILFTTLYQMVPSWLYLKIVAIDPQAVMVTVFLWDHIFLEAEVAAGEFSARFLNTIGGRFALMVSLHWST